LSLGALKGPTTRRDEAFRRALSDGLAAAREAAAEVRTLSHLLHPPLLHEFGLPDAIRTYVRGFSDRSGIQVGLRLPSKRLRFGEDLETSLFRVVQEGLTNVYRHSGRRRASVSLRNSRKNIVLEIRDFGPRTRGARGTPSKGSKPQGVGLAGIRERLERFGGRLEVQSSSKGTLLRAQLPLCTKNG
jgi:two-component system NarL family sensor kinase